MSDIPEEFRFEAPTDDDFEVVLTDEPPMEEEPPEEEGIPEEYKGMDKKALVEKLRKTQEEIAQQAQAPNQPEVLTEGFDRISESLKQAIQQGQQGQQQPKQLTPEELNEKFVDNPTAAMEEFYNAKLAPEVNRLLGNNMSSSRKFLMLDESRKDTANQYMNEIEAEVQRTAPNARLMNPDIYTEAHDRVIARHFNEIVDKKVKEALAAQQGNEEGATPTPSSHDETGVRRVATQGPQKVNVYLTPAEKRFADTKGITYERAGRLKARGKLPKIQ